MKTAIICLFIFALSASGITIFAIVYTRNLLSLVALVFVIFGWIFFLSSFINYKRSAKATKQAVGILGGKG